MFNLSIPKQKNMNIDPISQPYHTLVNDLFKYGTYEYYNNQECFVDISIDYIVYSANFY